MIGVLLVTHGRLAEELLAAAEKIAGALPHFGALSLEWSDGLEEARRRITEGVRRLDAGEGVLVLTDMFGDTPSNAALALWQPGKVEIISGVNLPMVVRLACSRSSRLPLTELARWLEVKGRRSIRRAGAVERGPLPGEGTNGG
ncbi:MAG TPA: PTS fructose transporter subunit IIA [Thermoanaerobaculia bacterium]|nr:PTS fructose transporter subunit IIA [Thermoanaerobaculia bacterium]